MLLVENQVRHVLLDNDIEPIVAHQVASALDGVFSPCVAPVDHAIQIDGMVSAERWPELYSQLTSVSDRVMQITNVGTNAKGDVDFTLFVGDNKLTEEEGDTVVNDIRNRWAFATADDDEVPEEADTYIND